MSSLGIWRDLIVEPLLLCVERSQLKWLRHLVWMVPGRLLLEVLWHTQLGDDLCVDPEPTWEIIHLVWPGNASGFFRRNRKVLLEDILNTLLTLLRLQPDFGWCVEVIPVLFQIYLNSCLDFESTAKKISAQKLKRNKKKLKGFSLSYSTGHSQKILNIFLQSFRHMSDLLHQNPSRR